MFINISLSLALTCLDLGFFHELKTKQNRKCAGKIAYASLRSSYESQKVII